MNVSLEKTWAEVDVRAPFAGVVLEKNVTTGDIVNTSLDLFMVADLARLGVRANVYEEDLPALESLGPGERKWTIHLTAQPMAPGISGTFDLISNIIDPNQHTATLEGWVDNKDGRLRVGQFITATVDLSSSTDEVAVPESAVLDEGPGSIVFVTANASCHRVTRRTVAVTCAVRQDFVFVRPTHCGRTARRQPASLARRMGCHFRHRRVGHGNRQRRGRDGRAGGVGPLGLDFCGMSAPLRLESRLPNAGQRSPLESPFARFRSVFGLCRAAALRSF